MRPFCLRDVCLQAAIASGYHFAEADGGEAEQQVNDLDDPLAGAEIPARLEEANEGEQEANDKSRQGERETATLAHSLDNADSKEGDHGQQAQDDVNDDKTIRVARPEQDTQNKVNQDCDAQDHDCNTNDQSVFLLKDVAL